MKAVIYSDGERLRCVAHGYPDTALVHFSSGGADPGAAAGDLQSLRRLLDGKGFECALGDGTDAGALRFERLGSGRRKWESRIEGIFESGPDGLAMDDSVYEKALALCPSPECVIIEDTIPGIRAIKEGERSGIAEAYAAECPGKLNTERRIPSVAAWVGDIGRFCELAGIFRRYGNWYGLLMSMRRSDPKLYGDVSRISRRDAIAYYRHSE